MPGARKGGAGETAAAGQAAALAFIVFGLGAPVVATAQPADLPIPAATTDHYPPGVHVATTPDGAVYTDARGRVLYGMDMRTLLRGGADPALHCVADCAQAWEPLLAPAGTAPNIAFPRERSRIRTGEEENSDELPQRSTARNAARREFYSQGDAPDWTVIAGPEGPQWVYKSWHMVFTRHGDKPGSPALDGAEDRTWNTLKFVPPRPTITAPAGVQLVMLDGGYALADSEGRVLFTGACAKTCSDWRPFAAAMASGPIGDWSVSSDGDAPQWTYRGKPVFVSQGDDPKNAPPSGKVVRP